MVRNIARLTASVAVVCGALAGSAWAQAGGQTAYAADYKTKPTADQLAQLRQIFPDGVCDYAKPGVEQARLAGTWVSFKGDGEFVALQLGHWSVVGAGAARVDGNEDRAQNQSD
jgi:Tannase-like family of unknown function (DUF6351)